ncbi:hypothetical protein D3C84_903250 [compost metagenome]
MGLIEHHQLVEATPLDSRFCKQLQEHDEESKSLVLLDVLISKVHDDQATRLNHFGERS